jgi:hypothetical protein
MIAIYYPYHNILSKIVPDEVHYIGFIQLVAVKGSA